MNITLRHFSAPLVALLALLAPPAQAQMMIAHMFHGQHTGCMVETGTYPVHFSAIPVPPAGQEMAEQHAHCDHLPEVGPIRLMVDLVNQEERAMPLAMRLIKVEGGQEKEVLAVPAKTYGAGFASIETTIAEEGQYALLLDFAKIEKFDEGHVRIPLHVGGGHDFPWGMAIGGLVLVFAAGGGAFFWLKRKPQS